VFFKKLTPLMWWLPHNSMANLPGLYNLQRISEMPKVDNIDIEKPGAVDDAEAAKGHALARVLNSAIKQHAASVIADAEESKEEKEKKDAAAKADAEYGKKLDKLLECLDMLGKRMDQYDAQKDAAKRDGAEAAMVTSDKKKKDAEGKEIEEEGDPRPLKADRKDSYRDSDEIRNELSEIQSDADRSCSAWNQEARRPMQNELPSEYRRRVARPLQQYSDAWKDVDLKELSGQALKVAADQIFKDSFAAATNNDTFAGAGTLRETRRTDPATGHRIREFYGDPWSWMQQFAPPRQRARFDMETIKKSMSKGWGK
jgi:hypothetical protein